MIYRTFAKNTNTLFRYKPLQNAGGDSIMLLRTLYPEKDSRILVSLPEYLLLHKRADKVKLRIYPAKADLLTNKLIKIDLYDTIDLWLPGFSLVSTLPIKIMPSNWVYRRRLEGQLVRWLPDLGGGIGQYSFSTKSSLLPRKWYLPIDFDLLFFDLTYNGFLLKYQLLGNLDIGTTYFYSSNTNTPFKPTFLYYIDDYSWTTSSKQIDDPDNFLIDILNIQKLYDRRLTLRFKIHLNPKIYSRDWTTSYWVEDKKDFCFKLLHAATYAVWDATLIEHILIIPHDKTYTRISCDGTKSYFDIKMSQFLKDRYYMLLVKANERIYPIKKYFKIV